MTKPYFLINRAADIPEILVYGYIGDEDVNAGDFMKMLRELEKDASKINVRINSGGGSVFDGIAIYNAMKNSKASIDTYVDGLAASMGSVIALGGKKCFMSKNARMMTHRASGFAGGGAESMRQTADLLESLEGSIAKIYASKTGLTADEAKAKYLTAEDKWMTADEALAEKLVDGIFDADEAIDVPASAKTDKEVWQVYNQVFTSKINIENMKQITLTSDQLAKLNLKAEAQPAEINNAIDALILKAVKVDQLAGELATAKTAKEQAESALSEFKKTASAKEVKDMLASAVKDGKLTVAASTAFEADYAENPAGLKKIIDALPKYKSLVEKIENDDSNSELAKLVAMSYDELDKGGKLSRLKELSLEDFKAAFKKQFNKEYTGA